jgi:hypothetical protein
MSTTINAWTFRRSSLTTARYAFLLAEGTPDERVPRTEA